MEGIRKGYCKFNEIRKIFLSNILQGYYKTNLSRESMIHPRSR